MKDYLFIVRGFFNIVNCVILLCYFSCYFGCLIWDIIMKYLLGKKFGIYLICDSFLIFGDFVFVVRLVVELL